MRLADIRVAKQNNLKDEVVIVVVSRVHVYFGVALSELQLDRG